MPAISPCFEANHEYRTKGTWPEEKCESSGEFPIISNPSSPEQAYNRPASKPKSQCENCWLPDDGFPSVSMNLGFRSHFNSFHQSSEYDRASLPSDAWEDDSIDGIIRGLLLDSNLSFNISKHGTSIAWSPSADPGLSACSLHTFNSCASSDACAGKNTPDPHQEFEISIVSSDLSNTVCSHGPVDLPSSDFSGDMNVGSDGQNKLGIRQSKPIKCAGSCSLLREQVVLKDLRHDSDGKDKDGIEGLRCVWNGSKLGSCMPEKECQSSCQDKAKDVDNNWSGAEGRSRVCEGLECVEPPCELMMLESRVLQLLCVHKGKKLVGCLK